MASIPAPRLRFSTPVAASGLTGVTAIAAAPTAPAQGEKNAAQGDATASTVGLIVGGVFVAAELVFYLTAPSKSGAGAGLELAPAIGVDIGGVLLRGGFQ